MNCLTKQEFERLSRAGLARQASVASQSPLTASNAANLSFSLGDSQDLLEACEPSGAGVAESTLASASGSESGAGSGSGSSPSAGLAELGALTLADQSYGEYCCCCCCR